MKRFNKNALVFILCMVFVITGLFSTSVLRPVAGSFFRLIKGQYTFEEAKTTITDSSNEALTYHTQMMDLNSIKDNLLGTRIIKKDDNTVVKTDSGSLIYSDSNVRSVQDLKSIASKIIELQNVVEENGAKFLYCAAPNKANFESGPLNSDNTYKINYDNYLKVLSEKHIPVVDFTNSLINNTPKGEKMYYITDHHWTSRSGFIAANAICDELSSRYGFNYNKEYTDINNYNVKRYTKWFLGSSGKKVGTYFTWNSPDDFELITPKFKTELMEEQPFNNSVRTGSFEESVLFMENMEKDYYNNNTYVTYSGGDFHLQIMKNNLNTKGKKILMIRDSFADVVAPFLAIQISELHICDMRDLDGMVGDVVNIKDYIKKENPDYVIVLYNGVGNKDDII